MEQWQIHFAWAWVYACAALPFAVLAILAFWRPVRLQAGAILSGICLVLSGVAWARGHHAQELVGLTGTTDSPFVRRTTAVGLDSLCGAIRLDLRLVSDRRTEEERGPIRDAIRPSFAWSRRPTPGEGYPHFTAGSGWEWLGLGILHTKLATGPPKYFADRYWLMVPGWACVSVFAIAFALFLRAWMKRSRARRRAKEGLCLRCGYDLRSHNPGDKCPECGTPKPASPSGSTPAPSAG